MLEAVRLAPKLIKCWEPSCSAELVEPRRTDGMGMLRYMTDHGWRLTTSGRKFCPLHQPKRPACTIHEIRDCTICFPSQS